MGAMVHRHLLGHVRRRGVFCADSQQVRKARRTFCNVLCGRLARPQAHSEGITERANLSRLSESNLRALCRGISVGNVSLEGEIMRSHLLLAGLLLGLTTVAAATKSGDGYV